MGLTNPAVSRHLVEGFARRCDADIDVATHNVMLCTLYHRCREKHPTEVSALAAAVAEV